MRLAARAGAAAQGVRAARARGQPACAGASTTGRWASSPAAWTAARARGPSRARAAGAALPYLLVGRFVAGKLGVRRLRRIVVTGGPVAARDARFFWALGLPVLETYGQAETAGPVFAQGSLDDAGTVGRALPGVEWRDRARRRAGRPQPRRWGRAGIRPATSPRTPATGRIRVRGRREDVVRTGGEEVIVAGLEAALCDSAFIRRSVVAPLKGETLTAIVEVDQDEAARWASEREIHFSTYGSLVARPEIHDLISDEVAAANERIGSRTAIADFIVLPAAAQRRRRRADLRALRAAARRHRAHRRKVMTCASAI